MKHLRKRCGRCYNEIDVEAASIKQPHTSTTTAVKKQRIAQLNGLFIVAIVSMNVLHLITTNQKIITISMQQNERNCLTATEVVHRVKQQPPLSESRPFPRWGASVSEENVVGIAFSPILNFIQTSNPYMVHSKEHRSTSDHGADTQTKQPNLPETLYMIRPGSSTGCSSNDRYNASNQIRPPILYVSHLHHLELGNAVAAKNETLSHCHKASLTERIMLHGLQALQNEVIAAALCDNQNGPRSDHCQNSQWPSLCRNLYPSLPNSDGDDTAKVGGFPFLAWHGDFTGCNYRNWQQQVAANNDTDAVTALPRIKSETETVTKYVSIPLFTVAANQHCNHSVPFPNFYQIYNSMDHSHQWETIQDQDRNNGQYSWPSKISKIVWRGSLTGRIDNNITKCPRWKMAEAIYKVEKRRRTKYQDRLQATLGINNTTTDETPFPSSAARTSDSTYQEIFDAKITHIPGMMRTRLYQKQLEHDIGSQSLAHDKIGFRDFQKYRGVIDIDGHSWSGRFGSLLCLNSVVLKVDPEFVEYFYARQSHRRNNGRKSDNSNNNHGENNNNNELRAWKHYIPIRSDFSNIEEMAEYVLDPANDDTLQEIVQNANEWCRQNMITSTIANDMLDVWDRYVELLNINNDHWTEQFWTEDVQAAILKDGNLDMVPLHISQYQYSPHFTAVS